MLFRTNRGGGVLVLSRDGAELDVLHLGDAAYDAAVADRSTPMTVLGSFAPLAGPASLGQFLVRGEVLDTNDFGGRRCPSEQTALQLWRIARWRGGAFWTAVASWVAAWVEQRVSAAPDGLPRHDLWGHGETHTRFLADAALLLTAVDSPVAARAFAGLDALSLPWGGGVWYTHDSDEHAAGVNRLVLNTHVQTIVALAAAGRDTTAAMRALEVALALRPDRSGVRAGYALTGAAVIRGWVPGRGEQRWLRVQQAAAEARVRTPHLVGPGGFIARDATAQPSPHYFTVNLCDLAALQANLPSPRVAAVLHAGLRFARTTRFFSAQHRRGDVLVSLVPGTLAMVGHRRAAGHWTDTLAADGLAPALGWPGHVDRPWPRLAAGTR